MHGAAAGHAHAPLRGVRGPYGLPLRLRPDCDGELPADLPQDVLRPHHGGVPGRGGRDLEDYVRPGQEQGGHAGVSRGRRGGLRPGPAGLHAGQQRRADGAWDFAGQNEKHSRTFHRCKIKF